MTSDRTPVRRNGERNVFCPFYNSCLDYVVKQSWEDWTCFQCLNQFNDMGKPELQLTVSYSIAYYDSMSMI
jgi:hypothetical protein